MHFNVCKFANALAKHFLASQNQQNSWSLSVGLSPLWTLSAFQAKNHQWAHVYACPGQPGTFLSVVMSGLYPACRLRWALRAATRMFPPPRPLSRDGPCFKLKYSCADVWLHICVDVCVSQQVCVCECVFYFFQTLFLRNRGSNGDQSKEGEGTGKRRSWWNYKRHCVMQVLSCRGDERFHRAEHWRAQSTRG